MAVVLQLVLPPSREICVLASGREEVSMAKGGRKRANEMSSSRPRKQACNLVPSSDRQTRSGQPLIHPVLDLNPGRTSKHKHGLYRVRTVTSVDGYSKF